MFGSTFWFAVVVTFLGELMLHWAPFPSSMPRVVSYGLGVATILAGAALWLLPAGYWEVFAGLLAICIAAGLATGLGYGIDAVLNLIVRAKVSHDLDRS